MQNLVIVESPTKARTLQKFLGDKYQIEASMGHIRDLPKGDLGVDVEHDFEPKYIIPKDKQKKVTELKKLAKGVDTLYLATDPDREGEAIAFHLAEILRDKDIKILGAKKSHNIPISQYPNIRRVVFHEITERAIREAFNTPREIDLKLVDAQQARRVLDRLVGYKLSPLLWQKIKKGLSAGRVQSVALRLIVEREKEFLAFKPDEYWSIEIELESRVKSQESRFIATLIEKDGKKVEIKNQVQALEYVSDLEKAQFSVARISKKEVRRFPHPPFTTSTLQQAAANKLGFSAKKTMMVAQNLYEQGFITYMRTDSVNLSETAITSVRDYIADFMGRSLLPDVPRIYKSKSKNAQEAHEAIRVTDVRFQSKQIDELPNFNRDHVRLYDLIWKRFVACQMSEAIIDQTSVDIKADSYLLRASGSIIKFDGWMRLYQESRIKNQVEEEAQESKDQKLPELSEGQVLEKLQVLPSQHFTEPPPRYNEASLIKKMEELGIGRPSTYAPTISTIQDRFYVERVDKKFIPTKLGITVIDFLMKYFSDIVDYNFTAGMEEALDEVARGERQWRPTIKDFYIPFEKKIEQTEKIAEKMKMEIEYSGKMCSECGKELIVRIGKFGKFLACSGFPECKHTESIEEKVDAKCPLDSGEVLVRKTRTGKTFYGCKNWPECKFASWTKPKASEEDKPEVKNPQ